ISDVHSNLLALTAVLEDMEERGVERIVSAGDVVGYNPFPNEVVSLFIKRDILSVMGNHDWAIVNDDYSNLNWLSTATDPWNRERLTQEHLEWLGKLPESLYLELEMLTMRVFHGGPSHIDQRIWHSEWGQQDMDRLDSHLLMVGHTHIPFVKSFSDGGGAFNPGSVGQPRDKNPLASYGILTVNDEKWKYENIRIPYDIDSVKYQFVKEGLPVDGFARLYGGE
ncbi:MAG TPA: metallophosphoesterase, partial [Euryarchaeota archaeon]|nr:metallophosphoesterase [Euryarchaeota archaeon]